MSVQKFAQYSSVLAQGVINVSYIIGGVGVLLVVPNISTSIAAKLFVRPASDFFATFGTKLLFHANFIAVKKTNIDICQSTTNDYNRF
jgi:succinate dehydrogenase hydrophobic anchor subunit